MVMVDSLITEVVERGARNLEFVAVETNTRNELPPSLATPNTVRLDLRTMQLRDYDKPGATPTLVHTILSDGFTIKSLPRTVAKSYGLSAGACKQGQAHGEMGCCLERIVKHAFRASFSPCRAYPEPLRRPGGSRWA